MLDYAKTEAGKIKFNAKHKLEREFLIICTAGDISRFIIESQVSIWSISST
jgi:hypothetical protein